MLTNNLRQEHQSCELSDRPGWTHIIILCNVLIQACYFRHHSEPRYAGLFHICPVAMETSGCHFFVLCCVPSPSCCHGHQVDRPFIIVCFVYQIHPVVTGTKWTGILLSCAVCNKCTQLPWAQGDWLFIILFCVSSPSCCHGNQVDQQFTILCCVYQVHSGDKVTGISSSCAMY